MALLVLLACAPESPSGDTAVLPECEYAFPLEHDGNAEISVDLAIPVHETAEYSDINFDWSSVNTSLACETIDPVADINSVFVYSVPEMSPEELIAALASDALFQTDINGVAGCTAAEETACRLSDFGIPDFADGWSRDWGIFLLVLQADAAGDSETYQLAVLVPDAASSVTSVAVEPGCGDLGLNVDLSHAYTAPEQTPDACAASTPTTWPVAWDTLSVAANGNAMTAADVDEVVVARYELSVEELSDQFGRRDSLAAERYRVPVSEADSVLLEDAKNIEGTAFSGFEGDGIWTVELRSAFEMWNVPIYFTIMQEN